MKGGMYQTTIIGYITYKVIKTFLKKDSRYHKNTFRTIGMCCQLKKLYYNL